jgi:hypothetical protein
MQSLVAPLAVTASSGGHLLPNILSILDEACLEPFQIISTDEETAAGKKKSACLIFCDQNPAKNESVQTECLKYISRIFFVPHVCSEPVISILNHPDFCSVMLNPLNSLKVQTSPKDLEVFLVHSLLDVVPEHRFKCGASTHILQCIYCEYDGMYRWGVISVANAERENITASTIWKKVENTRALDVGVGSAAVCRAYYKIQEIIEHYFPLWGWSEHWLRDSVVVDVGASPGTYRTLP